MSRDTHKQFLPAAPLVRFWWGGVGHIFSESGLVRAPQAREEILDEDYFPFRRHVEFGGGLWTKWALQPHFGWMVVVLLAPQERKYGSEVRGGEL